MPQVKIRLPPDVKAWLEVQVERNASSLISEIVRSVRERMDRDPTHVVPNGHEK